MNFTKRWLGVAFIGILLLTSCSSLVTTPTQVALTPQPQTPVVTEPPTTPTATPEPLAALVNGEPILLADYEREVARYEASLSEEELTTPEGQARLVEGRQLVLDYMIEQVLIEQQAEQAGISVSDEELDATIQALHDDIGEDSFNQWLEQEGMAYEEMREKLRRDTLASKMANQIADSVPTQTEHVHARHILVSTEEEARQILGQLQAGADFVTLAQTYSQDTSTRDAGGDLGFFPPGILTSTEVEAAAFSLQPGQISDVIQSSMGYHIVQVVEVVPTMDVSPDNLRLLRYNAVDTWRAGLRADADIQVLVSTTP